MNTDELIGQLAHDLQPVRPLPAPSTRTAAWLAFSAVYVLVLIAVMSTDIAGIGGIRSTRFWVEQAAACATAVTAALAALASVIPGRSRRTWLLPIAPMLLWTAALVWGCARDVTAEGLAGMAVYSDWPCVLAMVLGASLPAFVMGIMVRRGAPLAPRATGAFAALAGAGLSSVAACLSRAAPHPTTITVVVWHFGTLLMLVSIGAWGGGRFFNWRISPLMWRTQ
jgi:hypothetical protein